MLCYSISYSCSSSLLLLPPLSQLESSRGKLLLQRKKEEEEELGKIVHFLARLDIFVTNEVIVFILYSRINRILNN